ncbi:rod shape-determining protein RodA [Amylibacter kogurei]|uniref:Peptidoglycan glycosyltransferase MrdB n=1 Tax=Paramylibacter kogurei TaxID=1889778 RepID=A0A2G5K9Y8_9RHOB|nr:rod shape-determining protein RodA [Amylibacter kogurei]PIB25979.1 rod shape-determining protein RodA [Amylibacter kogurei]
MSYLERNLKSTPRGLGKVLYFHWPLAILIATISGVGFLMLYSVAGGNILAWAQPQMYRFVVGFVMMFIIAMIPIVFWQRMAIFAYLFAIALLLVVEFFGDVGGGAQRWIDLGFIRLQPSELMKIALVMVLASYYDWLDESQVSKPQWLLLPLALIVIPTALVLKQPDLGTAMLLVAGGGVVIFAAGVSLWYFAALLASLVGLVAAVFYTRGTEFELLNDYQYRRIETFLDPSISPYADGYHITQSKISLGSGGYAGRGFMEGTQSRGNFLPEKHTDFIFATLGEEFGFLGGITLLGMYMLIIAFCMISAMRNKNRFASLLTIGIAATFFFYFSVNMLMVMGFAPVVGVPLPLVSYGGSAMMVLLGAFGLIQSAHIHRPR